MSPPTANVQVKVLKTFGRIFCCEGIEAVFTPGWSDFTVSPAQWRKTRSDHGCGTQARFQWTDIITVSGLHLNKDVDINIILYIITDIIC